jgi:hypothetical protein
VIVSAGATLAATGVLAAAAAVVIEGIAAMGGQGVLVATPSFAAADAGGFLLFFLA